MKHLGGCYRLAVLSLIALVCSTTPLNAHQPSRKQPRFGGVLKVVVNNHETVLEFREGSRVILRGSGTFYVGLI